MLIIYLDFLRQLAPNRLQTIYLFFSFIHWQVVVCVGFTPNTRCVYAPSLGFSIFKNGFLMFVLFGLNAFTGTSTPSSHPFCGQTAHMVQHRIGSLVTFHSGQPRPHSCLWLCFSFFLSLLLPCLIKFWKVYFFRKVISFVSLHRWILAAML